MTRTTRAFESMAVGEQLPELTIDITRKLIISTAIASRDYQDVHHDHERAREKGSPDIFMNILTTNGLVGRFVTDWAGPEARIMRVKIRLGVPNYPGDRMVMRGVVDSLDGAKQEIEIRVRGANRLGDHVSGSVYISLPRKHG
jgi:acyl dehydratase